MITNRKFTGILLIIFISYLVFDIFLNDTIFYLLGGFFGLFSKWIGLESNAFYLVWLIFLISFVFLYSKAQHRLFKIVFIVLLWFLLYLIDVLLYEIITNINNVLQRYLQIILSTLIRSLVLSLIYFYKEKRE